MKKICLFGGTFAPPHKGHTYILNNLLLSDFDKIIIMPTGNVDYKKVSLEKNIRLNLVKAWLTLFHDERIILDTFELEDEGISYTAKTIKYLKDKNQVDKIYMAVGADSYLDIDNWNDSDYLKENIEFVVFNRNQSDQFLGTNIKISSTELRKNLNPYLIDFPVLKNIVTNQLFDLQPFIVEEMKVKPKINEAQEINRRVNYIKYKLLESNMKNLVLAISGGQDSTLCGKLCQLAIEQLGKDYSLFLIRLPYGNQLDEQDCQDAIKFINSKNIININIKDHVDMICDNLDNISDFNKGNIKARMRMVIQYAIAGSKQALVVGTDHSSENAVGFFTKFGDGGVDFNPLFGLNKRQGQLLLKSLNCPKHLYMKQPTADLEDNKPLYPDEDALGFSYNVLDDYLEGKQIDEEDKIKIEIKYINSIHKRIVNNYGELW